MSTKMWLLSLLAVVFLSGGLVWWLIIDSEDDSEVNDIGTTEIIESEEDTDTDRDKQVIQDEQIDLAADPSFVSYTNEGFANSNIGPLPIGTTVTFTNNSSSSNFWPASDPHPIHTDVSDFDSLGAVTPGDSYSFTFDEAGEFGFHNHLDSSEIGTIIIE